MDTLNLDASSFTQMASVADRAVAAVDEDLIAPEVDPTNRAIARLVLQTVGERGKQHNSATGSGGMLLGRVLQVAPGRSEEEKLYPGDRIASLASLTLTPLRIDRVTAVREASAQLDVEGEAVLFASAPCAKLPSDVSPRLALAVLDVAGAAPQVARLVRPGSVVAVLGAGGKSGILCVAEARRQGGDSARIVGVEASPRAAEELRALHLCDVVVADARDPLAVRREVLRATGGREADVTFSCVNVTDVEMAAVLATRDRGAVYFFAMSTSFTQAALGAEGLGKDVDLFIGNGYARGHAEHTLAMLREMPALGALFAARYG